MLGAKLHCAQVNVGYLNFSVMSKDGPLLVCDAAEYGFVKRPLLIKLLEALTAGWKHGIRVRAMSERRCELNCSQISRREWRDSQNITK